MAQLKILRLKRTIVWRVVLLRRCVSSFWDQILSCWISKSVRHRKLCSGAEFSNPTASVGPCRYDSGEMASPLSHLEPENSSDLVALKISLFGDEHIGKSSFLAKYVGKEGKGAGLESMGINQMYKTLDVRGARIAYNIWEVGGDAYCLGDEKSMNSVPAACKDSVAMIFMFDLTSRCTLNSIIGWYQQARKWNQTAIPVLVGTKFDDFIQLPIDLQWTIASQARSYAKALNATLFFSSASYNINVNKIFKFITAKLFNLPWTLERNLTIGEPMIDF